MMRVYVHFTLIFTMVCISGVLVFQRLGASAYPYDVIAYTDADFHLTIHDITTQITHVLTSEFLSVYQPQWSPNGDKLYFLMRDAEGVLHPAIIHADGSNAQYAYQVVINNPLSTGWSRDGQFILYFDVRDGTQALYRLNVVDITQRGERVSVGGVQGQMFLDVVDRRREGISTAPEIDRELLIDRMNGQWVLIMRDGAGNSDIVVRLTAQTIFNDGAYTISPDGARVLYEVIDANDFRHLYMIALTDGASSNRIPPYNGRYPSFQP